MRKIEEIIVHCSATPPSMRIGAEEIRQWHLERNWNDIGYHFVIRRDGSLENGRPIEETGAHAKGHNTGSVGVCLVGGVDENGKPDANFTLSQYIRLVEVINFLKAEYPDITKVSGHRDYSPLKACPCFDIKSLLS